MDTPIESQAQPACKYPQASTKHIVVTGRFAALLAEDFGLDWAVVVESLIGEPCKQAMSLCEWATERTNDPQGALLAWSRKHNKGIHRPQSQPYGSPGVGSDGGTNNTPARGDTRTAHQRGESLRGVLVNPERLAETAERLGV